MILIFMPPAQLSYKGIFANHPLREKTNRHMSVIYLGAPSGTPTLLQLIS